MDWKDVSDEEIYSLDYRIAEFCLPRLKAFKRNKIGVPCCFADDPKEWDAILNKMIFAMQCYANETTNAHGHSEKMQEGLELFGKYFAALWN